MTVKQIEVAHQALKDDDRIIKPRGGGQFLIERDVPEPIGYPPHTVYLFFGRSPRIKGGDDKWRTADGTVDGALTDELVTEWINEDPRDRIIFNPNDKES